MPDGLEIYFGEHLTDAQREMVRQSVTAMVENSRVTADAALAQLTEYDKLQDAAAPATTPIQADRETADVPEKLGAKLQIEPDSLQQSASSYQVRDITSPTPFTGGTVEIRRPPFDYGWNWIQSGGANPYSQFGNPRDGTLGVDARSGGIIQGGANRFVYAHIGVGCIVHADHRIGALITALRQSRYSYAVSAHGISANATSEGGLETTFMKGNQVLFGGTSPLWRKRVSGAEDSRFSTALASGTYPNGMGGQIDAGDYNFNVGIYAHTDQSGGIGTAGAQSIVQSNILEMQINRTG